MVTAQKDYAVIWDVDGTLVDTADLHFAAWTTLAAELDKPFSSTDFAATFGRRNPEIIRELFGQHYTDRQVDDLGFRKEEYYRAAARAGVALLPGVRSLLDGLKAAGYRQAIGSSAPQGNLQLILELTGLTGWFEAISSAEDTTVGKPHPDVFLQAARKLAAPPSRCLVIEDAVAGVQAAHAAGMKCIAVTFAGHHSPASLLSAGASLVVPTLEKVSEATIRQLLQQT